MNIHAPIIRPLEKILRYLHSIIYSALVGLDSLVLSSIFIFLVSKNLINGNATLSWIDDAKKDVIYVSMKQIISSIEFSHNGSQREMSLRILETLLKHSTNSIRGIL
jgi:hypothetical protein